ncbi:MAG: cellulase family glycosylhydrolase [Planctomycetota bacterium]|jgi:hypothetical protein
MHRRALTAVLAVLCAAAGLARHVFPAEKSAEMPFGDFSWMHGVNYTPSYAATDVEFWLDYDRAVIDRELGYAERAGLNCVRVFLQSLVYEHSPQRFLDNFEHFVATADRHGVKVMPILFDSCFGVSPSLESRHMWVANPGPDRMSPEHFPALDAYARAVVTPYVGDDRIALWDVMNEPGVTVLSLTEEGKARIWAFVAHYCRLVHEVDPTHAATVGVASSDNANVIDLVDVLSCHSYAPSREKLRENFAQTQGQARAKGKPWIVSECCAPGWGSRYEMVLPELRQFGVGHTVWELVIGRNQFAPISGLLYPDGTVRHLSSLEAVMNGPPEGFTEKPEAEGVPIARQRAGRLAEYVRFMARNAVTDSTWRERNTAVHALVIHKVYGADAAKALDELETARAAHRGGHKANAFQVVQKLLEQAAAVLTEREKAKPAAAPDP